MNANRIEAIMLHDATIMELRVRAAGCLVILLQDVTTYQKAGVELYDKWIHDAVLTISELTSLSIVGRGWTKDNDDYILTDKVIDSRGDEIHWTEIEGCAISHIELSIFSGASIKISCLGAKLKLSNKKKKVGQWEGPL